MKYTGRFKNVKEETILVNIITNNDDSQETELTFANDSPVVIVQDSGDGIFSPIKSRSCTITIVAEEPYYDMYSGTSHGTKVLVSNLGTGEWLFYGYLTPCEYNQPFLYLNEIELEAVDAVSTLQDFKYEFVNAPNSSIRTIEDIVKYCLYNVAGYIGGIYVPYRGLKSKKAHNNNFYPMELECISEEIFKDDDDMLSCYEVLEEICNFYNLSLVPYGYDVYFVDYKDIKETEFRNVVYGNQGVLWKDLRLNYTKTTYASKYINKEDYAGDDQNIELDEVYNKISIKADVKEIEEDDLMYDPLDDIPESRFVNNWQQPVNKNDNVNWIQYTRLFEYIMGSQPNGILDTNSKWKTPYYLNCQGDYDAMYNPSGSWQLTDNFTNFQPTNNEAFFHWKWKSGNYMANMNNIPAQCCLPSQLFDYETSKGMPYSTNWENLLLFFPHVEWIREYYAAQPNGMYSGLTPISRAYNFWVNDVYPNHLGGTNPVLLYRGETEFQVSPADNTKTNWLTFTGNLLWQQDVTYDHNHYHVWTEQDSYAIENHIYNGSLHPIKELGASQTHAAYTRNPGDDGYNTGWPMLKIMIKIGDKYWNGGTNVNGGNWTTTPTTGWIPYHKENVASEQEELIWTDYNKPVTNYDFTYQIEKEAFAIPIVKSDNLFGKVSIDIYMPVIPLSDGTLYYYKDSKFYEIPRWDPPSFTIYSNIYINHKKTPPCIFMKDLSLELVSTETNRNSWYFATPKKEEDDDIIYSNNINTNNVTEFDDLTLKINTYNDRKPIGLSYLLEPGISNNQADLTHVSYHTEGFYDTWDRTTKREEEQVIARYVYHYGAPQKIYNCQVHGYYEPWRCVHPNVLNFNELNPIYMMVDSQEYDVKADINELKLIQY